MSAHESFTDRVRCFYCADFLTDDELAQSHVCCRSCHFKFTEKQGHQSRVVKLVKTVRINMNDPAYVSIPTACAQLLDSLGLLKTRDGVYAICFAVRDGYAQVFVSERKKRTLGKAS